MKTKTIKINNTTFEIRKSFDLRSSDELDKLTLKEIYKYEDKLNTIDNKLSDDEKDDLDNYLWCLKEYYHDREYKEFGHYVE